MKKNLKVILSAALVATSIIAIAAPIGVSVSKQKEIDNLNALTIAGLKPTQEFLDLVNKSKTEKDDWTTALNKLNEFEDKKVLFNVVNKNGQVINDALTNEPIEGNVNFIITTNGNVEVSVPVVWDEIKNYNIPLELLNSNPSFSWGGISTAVKNDAHALLNEIAAVSAATDTAALNVALNAEKLAVANVITNGDKIEIGDIIVAEPNPNGFNITIPHTAKAGVELAFPADIIVSGFKINITPTLSDGYLDVIRTIPGAAAASTASGLRDILNAPAAKTILLSQILFENNEAITPTISTVGVIGLDPYTITITLEANGFNIPPVRITDFT